MRRAAAFFLLAALCLSLCACAPAGAPPVQSSPAPTVTPEPPRQQGLALAYDPGASLHPITGDSQVNRLLVPLVYEGLYRLDESFTPQPALAASAQADESGLRWTVTLAEGVLFSDGTPLTADHVVSSLNTARKSPVYAARLSNVTAVKAAEEGRMVITLSAPDRNLPALLDVPIVLEREEGEPLGTGRYRLARDGDTLSLLVNYNRAGELPYDHIRLTPAEGADRRISTFDSGMVTAVVSQPMSPGALSYSCSYEQWEYTTPELLYIGFHTDQGPCADGLVRRALVRAFDRVGLVEDILLGYGDPTALPVPTCHGDWDGEKNEALGYDLTAAAELLAGAGYSREEDDLLYKDREPLTLTLLVNSDNQSKVALARRAADGLFALGITVNVSALPWKGYVAALERGDFDLYLGEVRMTGDFDLTPLLAGELNYGGYTSELFDRVLAAWKAGQTGRRSLMWVLNQEAPMAPLCFRREAMLVRWGTVSGADPIWGDIFNGLENWVPGTE